MEQRLAWRSLEMGDEMVGLVAANHEFETGLMTLGSQMIYEEQKMDGQVGE